MEHGEDGEMVVSSPRVMLSPPRCGWIYKSSRITIRNGKERAKARHDRILKDYKADPENNPTPAKERPKDSIINKGTFVGPGGFMMAQEDTAFQALHKGKSWLLMTFDNGPGGWIDDVNHIHDQDFHKKHRSPQSTPARRSADAR